MTTTRPHVVSPEEWIRARRDLLADEKEATRMRDAVAEKRRRLPMVELVEDYRLRGPGGEVGLIDLFEGRRQLIVQHFMWDPSWGVEDACGSCTFATQDLCHLPHLHDAGVSFALVSRAPLETLERYRERMGWTVPWYSSLDSDFNYDFGVTIDEDVAPAAYNFRPNAEHRAAGMDNYTWGEQPGVSVFLREGNAVYRTYSAYARGTELLVNTVNFLDLTPFGRAGAP